MGKKHTDMIGRLPSGEHDETLRISLSEYNLKLQEMQVRIFAGQIIRAIGEPPNDSRLVIAKNDYKDSDTRIKTHYYQLYYINERKKEEREYYQKLKHNYPAKWDNISIVQFGTW